MKQKIILASLAIMLSLLSLSSFAQFQKGQLLLNGSVSFNSNNNTNNSDTTTGAYSTGSANNVALNLSVGKFVSDNTVYGAGISYSIQTSKNANNSPGIILNTVNNQTQSVGIRLFATRYFPIVKHLYFTMTGSVNGAYNFETFNQSYTYTNVVPDSTVTFNSKGNGFNVGAFLSPGFTCQLNQRLLLNMELSSFLAINYNHLSENNQTNNSFAISSGFTNSSLSNLGVGFSWLIHK